MNYNETKSPWSNNARIHFYPSSHYECGVFSSLSVISISVILIFKTLGSLSYHLNEVIPTRLWSKSVSALAPHISNLNGLNVSQLQFHCAEFSSSILLKYKLIDNFLAYSIIWGPRRSRPGSIQHPFETLHQTLATSTTIWIWTEQWRCHFPGLLFRHKSYFNFNLSRKRVQSSRFCSVVPPEVICVTIKVMQLIYFK